MSNNVKTITSGDFVKILNGKHKGEIGLVVRAQIKKVTINVNNFQVQLTKDDIELL